MSACAARAWRVCAGIAILTIGAPMAHAVGGGAEIEKRSVLRVCADPNSLPYSSRARTGFENKIAEWIAADLGVPLSYYWFPQSMGFVRTTLGARRCDLVIGVSAANELLLNTNAYYSSAFALVYPADAGHKMVSLADAKWKDARLRIGLIAGTPPTGLLLDNGLMEQVASYHLVVDTRVDSPSEQIVKDVLAGKLDAAVLWGPLAGYLNERHGSRLRIVPLVADHSQRHRMIYRITMGVRAGETDWKRKLNRFIRKNQQKLHALMREYGVPLVEEP